MSHIFGKLWHLAIIWAIRKAFQCILQGVRFLLANHTRLSPTSDNESYQKINLSTGWASYFCVTPLLETFLSGSLNWARFPLLSTSSPLLSWAFFWVAHSIEPSFEQIRSFEHLFERSKNRCTLENQIFRKIRIAKALLAPPTGSPSFACWLPWLKLRNNEEN